MTWAYKPQVSKTLALGSLKFQNFDTWGTKILKKLAIKKII